MVEVTILDASNANKWDKLVEKTSNSSVYHLWDWGEALSSAYGYQRYYLAAIQKSTIIGGLPLIHVKSWLFDDKLISLPFCEYGGPLVNSELSDEETRQVIKSLLNATDKLARTLHVKYVQIRKPTAMIVEGVMNTQGYTNFQRYVTFQTDLTRELDEIWANVHKPKRKAVRKALKSGVVAKEIERAEQLKTYYMLYLKDMKRQGSPPHKYKFFKRLYNAFFFKGRMKILLTEYKGKLIGGRISFCYGKRIFNWNNVVDTKYRSLNPNSLLLWNIIEWGVENGYHKLDFGRTRKGTTIYDFKRDWGGRETYLPEYVFFMDSRKRDLPDPKQRKYEYLSKMWLLMPISLTMKIGPKIRANIG